MGDAHANEGLPPWLVETIEAALAPHRGLATEAELAWMRERLVERLAVDADLQQLVRDAAPRIPTEESGKTAQPDALAGIAAARRDAASGKG